MNITELKADKEALKKILSFLPSMIEESVKLTEPINKNVLALKLYELEMYIKHALRMFDEQEANINKQYNNKKC